MQMQSLAHKSLMFNHHSTSVQLTSHSGVELVWLALHAHPSPCKIPFLLSQTESKKNCLLYYTKNYILCLPMYPCFSPKQNAALYTHCTMPYRCIYKPTHVSIHICKCRYLYICVLKHNMLLMVTIHLFPSIRLSYTTFSMCVCVCVLRLFTAWSPTEPSRQIEV